MPRIINAGQRADGTYNFYCRQCGKIHTQEAWPDHCDECGNPEVDEGWGVSGDNSVSNTTVTISRENPGRNFLAVGTIDKPRK